MSVDHIEVLVEEPSAEALLRVLLPSILGDLSFAIYTYSGKHDLLQHLRKRLQGYSRWLPSSTRVVVLVDRDADDCQALKRELEGHANAAGLQTRSTTISNSYSVVNRLAIEELEAWFFGDWDAVCAAYPRVSTSVPRRARYRDPDSVPGGTSQAFERILQRAGYFGTGLRKIEAARAIAQHMEIARNRSHSFQVFRRTLTEFVPGHIE